MYQLVLERRVRDGPPRLEDVVLGQWQANEMGQSACVYGNSLKVTGADMIRVFNVTDDTLRLSPYRLMLMHDEKQVWELKFYAYPEHVDEMVETLCLKTTAASPSL